MMVAVLALNIHAGYACRHAGACCTAGWPIPVEAGVAARLEADAGLPRAALAPAGADAGSPEAAATTATYVGRAAPGSEDRRAAGPAAAIVPGPDDSSATGPAAVIVPGPDGACPFFERASGGLCAIQRRLGHEALPAACRHFPRIALLEPDAVRVTLSHFCPTAARLLFRDDVDRVEIVEAAPGITDRSEYEGFDARQTIPPFLRPGVATDPATCRLWERHLIRALDTPGQAPDARLAAAALAADRIRAWDHSGTSLEAHTRSVLETAGRERQTERWHMTPAGAARLFDAAVVAVPEGLAHPAADAGFAFADRRWVQPHWTLLSRPVGRYLAARAFAAWSAYLGDGLRTQVAMLAVALAAVRVEAARLTAREARPLDAEVLHAAFRSADLLVHHLADARALARALAGVERDTTDGFLAALGLEAPA